MKKILLLIGVGFILTGNVTAEDASHGMLNSMGEQNSCFMDIVAQVPQSTVCNWNKTGPVLPPKIYAVEGLECNVYFDNLFLDDASDYGIDVDSPIGQQQNKRFTVVPTNKSVTPFIINVFDKKTWHKIEMKTAQLIVAPRSAGSGKVAKVMLIGDSLTNSGFISQTLLNHAEHDPLKISLIGTRGKRPNYHEGRGGWTVNAYTSGGITNYNFTVSSVSSLPAINSTKYGCDSAVLKVQEENLSNGAGSLICSLVSGQIPSEGHGILRKISGDGDENISFSSIASTPANPFWRHGTLSFSEYLAEHSLSIPDIVVIQLGTNDVFIYNDDTALMTAIDKDLTSLDTLIASIQDAGVSKIGLMIVSPPASDQDAFGANYGCGQLRARVKRNYLLWAKQMISKYNNRESDGIYLVPSNVALDTVNNMVYSPVAPVNSRSNATMARQNNGVHPAISGYQQIGDALWAFIKCQYIVEYTVLATGVKRP